MLRALSEDSTFEDLERFAEKVGVIPNNRSGKNVRSVLRKFVNVNGLCWTDPAKYALLEEKNEQQLFAQYKPSTVGSVKTRLGKLQRLVRDIGQNDFAVVLAKRLADENMTTYRLGRIVGMSAAPLDSWLSGTSAPSISSIDRIVKVLKVLEIDLVPTLNTVEISFDCLSKHLTEHEVYFPKELKESNREFVENCIEARISQNLSAYALLSNSERKKVLLEVIAKAQQTLEHRKQLQNYEKRDVYYLKKELWPSQLELEFVAYTKLRTDETLDPTLNLERHSVIKDATLGIHQGYLESIMGFSRWRGVNASSEPLLQLDELTFCVYLSTSTFSAYRSFLIARNNVPYGVISHVAFAKSLLNSTTGFLTQKPEPVDLATISPSLLIHRSPAEVALDGTRAPHRLVDFIAKKGWAAACERAYTYYAKLSKELQKLRPHYVGMQSVMPLITIDESGVLPLDRIREMTDDMTEFMCRRYRPDSARYSTLSRDILMIEMATEMPLRLKHWAQLLVEGKDAHLVKRGDNYYCTIKLDEFKNAKALHRRHHGHPYEYKLSKELSKKIDEYLQVHRPRLLGDKHSSHLFITQSGTNFSENYASTVMYRRTSQFIAHGAPFGRGIEGLVPFCIHAMRYICASHYVGLLGEFTMAAKLLADSVEIVSKVYAFALPKHSAEALYDLASLIRSNRKPRK